MLKIICSLSGLASIYEWMMVDDMELVREFATRRSDAAFETLVSRHINLVYSVALRQVRDPHLAQEVTQAVFIILARKAGSLGPKTILSGWLYRTTQYAGADALKIQRRRQHREQEACMQSILNEPESAAWTQIAPLLDAAMLRLGEKDRNAIVLRFFENKNLREVGAALGASEDSARVRINRALEKLRKFFTKRGVMLSATVIATAVSANSVQAAPLGLATTISAAAVKSSAIAASTLTLVKGALKLMAWSKAKTTIVVGVAAILAIGATTAIVEVALPTPDIQGTWIGTISLDGWGVQAGESPKTRLVLRITKANNDFQVIGNDIDRGYKDVPVNLTYKYPHLHAEIPGSPDSFDGMANRAGTEISGKWKENNGGGPLVFRRTSNPPSFPEPLADAEFVPRAGSDLQGFWKGVIKTGKNGLEVNIKIGEASDGTFRADFYCPPQGGVRQPTSVSYDGTTVKLMPMAGYGMFQGTLRNGGREMTGNWIQKGGHVPTTFTRAN